MLKWRWRHKTTKVRLVASDAIDSGVHLTHLIEQMVKTTTKISTHVLKLLHDVNKGDNCPRWKGRGKGGTGLRGRGCRVCRGCICGLHMWPLCSKLCCTPPNKLLTYGTHDIEERKGRNNDMHVCEDARDSQRKDELIMCSHVLIAINNRFYRVWWKVYMLISYFYLSSICVPIPKNLKISFSLQGAMRTSRTTWRNSFRH